MGTMALATPEVLTWARHRSGYSASEIADKMRSRKVTKDTIEAWESGKDRMTYTQLRKLADIYKRPIAVFFLSSPPSIEETLETKFRSLPKQYVEEIPPHIRLIVRRARVKQMELAELHGGAGHTRISNVFPSASSNSDVREVAQKVRSVLGISLEEQKKFKDAKEALKRWRHAFEEVGLWVFKASFNPRRRKKDKQPASRSSRRNQYDGFYLPDDYFPVVYVHSSARKTRQIFTLFHELGHVLLNKGGVSFRSNMEAEFPSPFDEDEMFCNAFAGEFLVPSSDLRVDRMLEDEEIKSYAKEYKVSGEVILRKCKDKEFISWAQYNKKIEAWMHSRKRPTPLYSDQSLSLPSPADKGKVKRKVTGGGAYYSTKWAHLGEKYISLAFSQYYQSRISEQQLADYLGVKVSNLAKIEARLYPE